MEAYFKLGVKQLKKKTFLDFLSSFQQHVFYVEDSNVPCKSTGCNVHIHYSAYFLFSGTI